MYPAQERNCIQHHCHGGSVSCRRGQGFIFVYRLVLDAKPVRVDDVAG